MNWLRRFMYGRYGGNDALSRFLFVAYVILFVLQMVFARTKISMVFWILGWGAVIYYFFRCFSKNIYARSGENQKFMAMIQPVRNYFKYVRMKWQERNGVKKLFRCPKCHQIIRVPKDRGKIAITCPKCRFEFIKRT